MIIVLFPRRSIRLCVSCVSISLIYVTSIISCDLPSVLTPRQRSPEVSVRNWFRTPKLPPNPVSDLCVSFGLRNYLRNLAVWWYSKQTD